MHNIKDFILKKLQEIIADRSVISQSSVTMETNFRRNLNMDSLDIVEVVLEVEKTFDCSIDDDELEKIKDVSDLVDVISGHSHFPKYCSEFFRWNGNHSFTQRSCKQKFLLAHSGFLDKLVKLFPFGW